jgi:hypothetical protein
MRRLLTLLLLVGFTFASCIKDDTNSPIDPGLAGRWEMISVRDDSANTLIAKPASIPENIDITITFTSSTKGNVSGSLTTAITVKGDFSIDQYKAIAIPAIIFAYPVDIFYGSMDWDNQFSNHITGAEKYYFDSSGDLNISCRNNITLNFIKLQ